MRGPPCASAGNEHQRVAVVAAFAPLSNEHKWAALVMWAEAAGAARDALSAAETGKCGLWHTWDGRSQRDFWISSDGVEVDVILIEGLTQEQAENVRERWESTTRDGGISCNLIREIINTELGGAARVH